MKVSRYRERGSTHSRGTAATSWLSWLVIAISSADPAPARRTHRSTSVASPEASSPPRRAAARLHPLHPQRRTIGGPASHTRRRARHTHRDPRASPTPARPPTSEARRQSGKRSAPQANRCSRARTAGTSRFRHPIARTSPAARAPSRRATHMARPHPPQASRGLTSSGFAGASGFSVAGSRTGAKSNDSRRRARWNATCRRR